MIEASLRAHLGEFRLTADFEGSEVICIVGKIGAGKTTLLRAMAGCVGLDHGHVAVGGARVERLPAEKRGIVLVTPGSYLPRFDVDSHLRWGARLQNRETGEGELARVKSELGIDFGGTVGKLSTGMRERVALATALIARPKAILVDEGFSGIHDREDFVKTYERLLRESGVELVFTSQDEADWRLARSLYRIAEGKTAKVQR